MLLVLIVNTKSDAVMHLMFFSRVTLDAREGSGLVVNLPQITNRMQWSTNIAERHSNLAQRFKTFRNLRHLTYMCTPPTDGRPLMRRMRTDHPAIALPGCSFLGTASVRIVEDANVYAYLWVSCPKTTPGEPFNGCNARYHPVNWAAPPHPLI